MNTRSGTAIFWLLLAACDVDFNRMIDQPSYRPYERNTFFADEMAMRRPPAHTVAWSRSPALRPESGAVGGAAEGAAEGPEAPFAAAIPIAVDDQVLARGQDRYRAFCAPCHGHLGDSNTYVARTMRHQPPAVLVEAPVRDYPPGRIYRAVEEGYGLMRSYRHELAEPDRWAVVAYVQALALARRVRLDELPPTVREEASRWLH